MKVSIGMKLQPGPFGGGNQFGQALIDFLQQKEVAVYTDLNQSDLDLVLLTEPRPRQSSSFGDQDIFFYRRRNLRTIFIHRINECDERKGTDNVNKILRRATLLADHTVFVSTWLRDLHLAQDLRPLSSSVILNGSDTRIFNANGYTVWNREGPLRLVTHHWGASWSKGFDIYKWLDDQLEDSDFQSRYDFTYIGNLPQGFRFRNAKYIPPLSGYELAATIRQNHVYVTASRNEPGSNHQNEGALCGLPLLYINSGGMGEYANGYGIPFEPSNFPEKLEAMKETYHDWVTIMKNYPHTAQQTCQQYYELFLELLNNRDQVLGKRRPLRQAKWVWLYGKESVHNLSHKFGKRIYRQVRN